MIEQQRYLKFYNTNQPNNAVVAGYHDWVKSFYDLLKQKGVTATEPVTEAEVYYDKKAKKDVAAPAFSVTVILGNVPAIKDVFDEWYKNILK